MILEVISTPIPGGWDFYCDHCDLFFSVQSDRAVDFKYCPVCGWDALTKSQEEFDLAHPHYGERRTA
jgi:hypothetical protein